MRDVSSISPSLDRPFCLPLFSSLRMFSPTEVARKIAPRFPLSYHFTSTKNLRRGRFPSANAAPCFPPPPHIFPPPPVTRPTPTDTSPDVISLVIACPVLILGFSLHFFFSTFPRTPVRRYLSCLPQKRRVGSASCVPPPIAFFPRGGVRGVLGGFSSRGSI